MIAAYGFSQRTPTMPNDLDRAARRCLASVVKRYRDIESCLDKGKGTWPNVDYVRDQVWDGWNAAIVHLSSCIRDAGLDPLNLPTDKELSRE